MVHPRLDEGNALLSNRVWLGEVFTAIRHDRLGFPLGDGLVDRCAGFQPDGFLLFLYWGFVG